MESLLKGVVGIVFCRVVMDAMCNDLCMMLAFRHFF